MTARDEHAAVVADLRVVRDAWQWKGWSDVLIPDPTSNPIANGQRVTEWLDAQIDAALADQPTPTQAGRDETAALRAQVEAVADDLAVQAVYYEDRSMAQHSRPLRGIESDLRAALASCAPTAGEADQT